ncbi:MAG: hypothetical protein H0U71_08970 [Gammaproteobacteria bacterium]|nr:hypothetical protein [Gammaproteobacteria bacterium]
MENILITTICKSDTNTFNELAKLAGKYDCHISFSHVYTLGLDNTITAQVAGNWSGIAKIEAALPALAKSLDIEVVYKRSHQEKVERYFLPYNIEIVAVDQPGVVHEITEFFTSLEVFTQYLVILTSMHQQTPILKIQMQIDLPADNNIADIREQFLIFCDELNLDGIMEPQK